MSIFFHLASRSFLLLVLLLVSSLTLFGQESLTKLMLDVPASPAAKTKAADLPIAPDDFFSHKNPPSDTAPIQDLIKYWKHWSNRNSNGFRPRPSEYVGQRLLAEMEAKPDLIVNLMIAVQDIRGAGMRIRRVFESTENEEAIPRYQRRSVTAWLIINSDLEVEQLETYAKTVKDDREYVTNSGELLALAKVDWERAKPIVEKLAENSDQPVSQTLAFWTLYRNAVAEGNSSEAESYRSKLKEVVENTSAGNGSRDMALDALVRVGDFPGRDEWYLSLFSDETLLELRVNGTLHTGLTTMISYSPPERFVEPLVGMSRSSNVAVRAAAIQNLGVLIPNNDERVIRALLPWLQDEKWAKQYRNERNLLVYALTEVRVPDSVPGLLSIIDSTTATIADKVEPKDTSDPQQVEQARRLTVYQQIAAYDLRKRVVEALAKQADLRAVDSLRRLLPLTRKDDRKELVDAIYQSGGYTSAAQVAALETIAIENIPQIKEKMQIEAERLRNFDISSRFIKIEKTVPGTDSASETPSSVPSISIRKVVGFGSGSGSGSGSLMFEQPEPFDPAEVVPHLAVSIENDDEPSAEFLTELAFRIQTLAKTDKFLSASLRSYMLGWSGRALYKLLLSDLSAGNASIDSAIKLLANRSTIKSVQPEDAVIAINSLRPETKAIGLCILEDSSGANEILLSKNNAAKSAVFSCARLVRMDLPFEYTKENLESSDPLLSLAASRYLESVDTAETRQALWDSAPGQAWILGARHFYGNSDESQVDSDLISKLFVSVGRDPDTFRAWEFYQSHKELEFAEKKIRKQLVDDDRLLGVYWYDGTYIKVTENSAELMWEKDPARYRTRMLSKPEYDAFRALFASAADLESAPFLGECDSCESKQLVLASKNGGRRVFVNTNDPPVFIRDLEQLFASFKEKKAELRYWAGEKVKGLEVVFADDRLEVVGFVSDGEKQIVTLKDLSRTAEIEKELDKLYMKDLYDSEVGYELTEPRNLERRKTMPLEAYSWRLIDKKGVGSLVSRPAGFELSESNNSYLSFEERNRTATNETTRLLTSDEGLFIEQNSTVSRIAEGKFFKPVIDKDGESAVVLNIKDKNAILTLIDLRTGKSRTISLPADKKYAMPYQYLTQIKKFLIYVSNEVYESTGRVKDGKPFLLDPRTGLLQEVKGDITPLLDIGDGELPRANSKYWVAISKNGGTSIGTYSLEDFKIQETIFIPWLQFTSETMIIEESGDSALVVYNGQIVRVPTKEMITSSDSFVQK